MVKPFAEQGHYTEFHNVALDIIMPKVSGNAWKVLCLIIRKTKGYRKESDKLSYSQLRKGTGIVSNSTVQDAINELLEGKYILAIPGKGQFDPTSYSLNRDLEIELPAVTETVTGKKTVTKTVVVTETVTAPTTETVTAPTTETVKTKEIQRNKESNMAHSRPATVSIREWYKSQLAAIDKGEPPLTNSGKKKTPAGVIAEMIDELYGGKCNPAAVGAMGKQIGHAWKTFDFVLAHAKDEVKGDPIAYLLGCWKAECNRPKNGYSKPEVTSVQEMISSIPEEYRYKPRSKAV